MKRFILDCLFYFVLIAIILFALKSSVPYHWGNEGFTAKINHINNSQGEYNSLCLGSSMFYRHFSPLEFDKVSNTELFNLSTIALFFLEADYLYENYLHHSTEIQDNPRNFFFLIQTPIPFNKNVHTIRGTYYLDFKRYLFAVKYFRNDIQQVFKYTKGFLENKLCMGQIRSMLSFHFREFTISKFDIQQSGFYSLDDQLRREDKKSLKILKSKFEKNPKVKTNMIGKKDKKHLEIKDRKEYLYKDEIDRLTALSEEKNITLFRVHLPNSSYGYQQNDEKALFLGTGVSFPEYYLPEYRFEKGHLNKKGAKLFTKRLADEYNKHENSKLELSYY